VKVPVEWLGELIDIKSIGADKLDTVLTMAGLEVEETHQSAIGPVFVTKVTPNRGDWMSITGVAREAVAALSITSPFPLKQSPILVQSTNGSGIDVSISIEAVHWCSRYAAAVIEIPNLGTSPDWMQGRLIAAGLRPINAPVDVTNYVMIALGQPLHAFDLDKISGQQIIVRAAKEGETIVTLDGTERLLTTEMLVIADSEKPIAIAGVMGGQGSEVTASTKRILLESAHFDPMVVRAAAKMLGLSTDASYRFERHVDPAGVVPALLAAAKLIADSTGGKIVGGHADVYPTPLLPRTIDLRISRASSILGVPETAVVSAEGSLAVLGLTWIGERDHRCVTVPTWRPDIVKEIDVIEEIGRMLGYGDLPETLPPARSSQGGGRDSEQGVLTGKLRNILIGQGLTEIFSHTLSAPSPFDDPVAANSRVKVRSALSAELSGLRQSLVPNLLEAFGRNARLRNADINSFEVGSVFSLSSDGKYVQGLHAAAAISGDYFTAKGIVEAVLTAAGVVNVQSQSEPVHGMHPGRAASLTINGKPLGMVAEVNPFMLTQHLDVPATYGRVSVFEIDLEIVDTISIKDPRYSPLPKFPEVTRDLAMLFDSSVAYGEIEQIAKANAGPFLERVSLQSVYAGERVEAGKKSVALRFVLRAPGRTLTDSDADSAIASVQKALTETLAAEKR
jgi:phenylalanyl-tRNA synthetase beta chain